MLIEFSVTNFRSILARQTLGMARTPRTTIWLGMWRPPARTSVAIAARNLVESSPEILGGTPVIRGTRVPVYDVAALVSAGIPIESILGDYPTLDREKVELAAIFAEANPPRGRPRVRAELPKGAVIVSDRRVARRRKAT